MLNHILFISIILLIYIFFTVTIRESKNNVNVFISLVSFVLIMQSSLRNVGVGADTYAYYVDFETVKLMTWDDIFENFKRVYVYGDGKDAGFPLLEKCFQLFSNSYRAFLVFVAIIFFSSLSKLFKRYLNTYTDVLLATSLYLMLFYSFFSITGIRQTISVALSIHALLSLIDKKWIKYMLFTIIAFFIHCKQKSPRFSQGDLN